MAKEKTSCPTCGHPMNEYIFTFSYLDAQLLLAMARQIKKNKLGSPHVPFSLVNKVHLTKAIPNANLVNRSTIASKLGLIAKVKNNGKHVRGMWLITARGWAALRGDGVPQCVSVFRGKITERTDGRITIADALRSYPDSDYISTEWYEFGEIRASGTTAQLL